MQDYTLWAIAALSLAGLELISGTFYLLVLGIAAGCTAFAAWIGAPMLLQFLLYAFFSVLGVVFIRRQTPERQPDAVVNPDAGHRVEIEVWLDHQHARVRYRGTFWDAIWENPQTGEKPEHFVIDRIEGNTLYIRTSS